MFSKIKEGRLVIDRRDLMRGAAAAGAAALIPGMASAQRVCHRTPVGAKATFSMNDAMEVDVSSLEPGEMIMLEKDGTWVGVLRRTAEQRAAAEAAPGVAYGNLDRGRVVDPDYLVTDLMCTHKPNFVEYTGKADVTFHCPCHGTDFDASGRMISGRGKSDLIVHAHTIANGIVTFAQG